MLNLDKIEHIFKKIYLLDSLYKKTGERKYKEKKEIEISKIENIKNILFNVKTILDIVEDAAKDGAFDDIYEEDIYYPYMNLSENIERAINVDKTIC